MFFEKRKSNHIRGSGIMATNGQMLFDGNYVNADKAIQNSDVWTAVSIISADIARVRLHSSHAATEKLLNDPSVLTNRFSFMQAMVAQMLLTGDAYAIYRKTTGRSYYEFVKPSNVTVYLADDGQSLTYDVRFDSKDEQDLEGVPAEEMLHYRWQSFNGMTGRSPLESLRQEMQLQDTARKLSLATLKHAIAPTSLIKSTSEGKLESETRERIRQDFEKANSGDNIGRLLIMDSIFDYQQLEVKPEIAKLLNSQDWTSKQIAKVFLVPIDMLGGESEHSNVEQVRGLYVSTIGRYLAPILEEHRVKEQHDVTADIREVLDVDGSDVERRVIALLGAQAIDVDVAKEILLQSTSDLMTNEIIEAVETKRKEATL